MLLESNQKYAVAASKSMSAVPMPASSANELTVESPDIRP